MPLAVGPWHHGQDRPLPVPWGSPSSRRSEPVPQGASANESVTEQGHAHRQRGVGPRYPHDLGWQQGRQAVAGNEPDLAGQELGPTAGADRVASTYDLRPPRRHRGAVGEEGRPHLRRGAHRVLPDPGRTRGHSVLDRCGGQRTDDARIRWRWGELGLRWRSRGWPRWWPLGSRGRRRARAGLGTRRRPAVLGPFPTRSPGTGLCGPIPRSRGSRPRTGRGPLCIRLPTRRSAEALAFDRCA